MLVANARAARRALPVPLALENIAALLEWPGAEMDEAIFLAEALERADALLLLDVANVYANAQNHGWDPLEYLDRLPLERLAYVHVAGGVERGGLYHDSHAHPVPAGVFGLLEELHRASKCPGCSWSATTASPRTPRSSPSWTLSRRPWSAEPPAGKPPMFLLPEARERLAAQQAALLQALANRAAPPEGFDPALIRATADALARKRTPGRGPRLAFSGRHWATVSGRSSPPLRRRPARPATVGPSPTAAPSPARSPTGENCRRPPTSR